MVKKRQLISYNGSKSIIKEETLIESVLAKKKITVNTQVFIGFYCLDRSSWSYYALVLKIVEIPF
jgi:hypothetical protein